MYGLQLQTQNLEKQHDFYAQLGFTVVEKNRSWSRFQLGSTVLDFESTDIFSPQYCFQISVPVSIFNSKMNEWSASTEIRKRKSVFHPRLKPTWYLPDISHNVVELFPSSVQTIGITGVVMIVPNVSAISQQLRGLGLSCIFIDQSRCILQNSHDATQIVLIKSSQTENLANRRSRTIPTMKSNVFATVCVRNTPHYLYMVKT